MQILVLFTIFCFFSVALAQSTIFEFDVEDAEGKTVSLSKYSEKKVIIVVNVASNCGYTYTNYKGLVDLYAKYQQHGLEILAFPSNQFGEQEPGTDEEIQAFCGNYGVTFPVFKKVNVNGPNALPLFKFLKQKAGRSEIQWNFSKFVVVNGKPIYRYGSNVKPTDMEMDVQHHLGWLDTTAEEEEAPTSVSEVVNEAAQVEEEEEDVVEDNDAWEGEAGGDEI